MNDPELVEDNKVFKMDVCLYTTDEVALSGASRDELWMRRTDVDNMIIELLNQITTKQL